MAHCDNGTRISNVARHNHSESIVPCLSFPHHPHLSAPGTALLHSHIAPDHVAASGRHGEAPTTRTLSETLPSHSSSPIIPKSTNTAIKRVAALKTDRADIAHIEAQTDEVTVAAKV